MKSLQNAPDGRIHRVRPPRHRARRAAIASMLALCVFLLLGGVASAHALLVRSDPPAGAILDNGTAPSELRLWFSEEINPALTKAIVVDQNNKEVDRQDSRVSSSDPRELDTGLQPLSPGFYVVVWKSVSAEDGHATGGNFLFRVRFPDGTVPALPSELPTGPAGFANTNSGQCLTGSSPLLCAPEVLSDWLVFLAAVIWVGGMFWLVYIIERAARADRSLIPTALAAARRFRRVAVIALLVFLVANLTYVIGQAMLAGGSWGSGFSPTILSGNLLYSSFGIFWLLRELLALVALLWLVVVPEPAASAEHWRARPLLNWARLALGLLVLGALAFSGHAAAAEARGGLGSFAVPVDWLHLLSTSIWVGGIIFIALTLLPAIWSYEAPGRAQALVKLLPRFSVIALVSVTVAALSGSFNADVQLTSWSQFIDTTYGRTLIIKILLVCVMILISGYHAFRVRPRLSRELNAWDRLESAAPALAGAAADGSARGAALAQDEQTEAQPVGADRKPKKKRQQARQTAGAALQAGGDGQASETAGGAATALNDQQNGKADMPKLPDTATAKAPPAAPANGHRQDASEPARARIEHLSEQLRLWLRREATLGVGVLFCAALLGGLAGSLAPTPPGAPNINAPTLTATTKTPVDMSQTIAGLQVTLKVAPDKFGTNSVGVLIIDTKTGKPVDGANVHLIVDMVEMDMGTSTSDLTGSSDGSGFYTGQIDLLMGGHWNIQVQIRTPQNPNTIQRATFTIPVSF